MRRSLLLTLALLMFLCLPCAASAQAPTPQQAGLIIVGEKGAVATYCITFTEPALTGLVLLERAGVALTVHTGGGAAICGIGELGCPATDCFCQCKAAPCRYWSYFHREADGTWRYSARGADSWPIANGDVDAWVWGDGATAPPALSLAEICAPAPTATPPLAETPLPPETPAASPQPTATPAPAGAEAFTGYGLFAALLLILLGTILVRRARRR